MKENKTITVCDSCLLACCWQGEFMCEDAYTSGTVDKTVKELRELRQQRGWGENEEYWEKAPNMQEP